MECQITINPRVQQKALQLSCILDTIFSSRKQNLLQNLLYSKSCLFCFKEQVNATVQLKTAGVNTRLGMDIILAYSIKMVQCFFLPLSLSLSLYFYSFSPSLPPLPHPLAFPVVCLTLQNIKAQR